MKRIIGILCGLFFFLFSFAQETFQKETYISSRGDTLLYRLLRPEVMKPDEKYPLVLFLHGAGERGNDNEKQLVHGGQMWLNPVNREKYPAFILLRSVLKPDIGHIRSALHLLLRQICRWKCLFLLFSVR